MAMWAGDGLLTRLERSFRDEGEIFHLQPYGICVAAPADARKVLGNAEGRYEEHSDFFQAVDGRVLPRNIQLIIGRQARTLCGSYAAERAAALDGLIDQHLGPLSYWPDAGNRLLHAFFKDVLLHPDRPEAIHRLANDIVTRAVLAGQRERQGRLRRLVFRSRAVSGLAEEIRRERRRANPQPRDLLGIVATAAPRQPPDLLVETFLSLLFALTGSVGFLVGWSVFLAGTGKHEIAPMWTVREALRLWPVAWLFGRRAARDHRLGLRQIATGDPVTVCSYLVHRHPDFWEAPHEFRPQRWATRDNDAFIPFGWGAHACTGASVAMRVSQDILQRLMVDSSAVVRPTANSGPHVGSALAPPAFWLERTRHTR